MRQLNTVVQEHWNFQAGVTIIAAEGLGPTLPVQDNIEKILSRAGLGEEFWVQFGLKNVQCLHPDGSPKSCAGAGLKAANKHACFCIKTSCCFKEMEALPIF